MMGERAFRFLGWVVGDGVQGKRGSGRFAELSVAAKLVASWGLCGRQLRAKHYPRNCLSGRGKTVRELNTSGSPLPTASATTSS